MRQSEWDRIASLIRQAADSLNRATDGLDPIDTIGTPNLTYVARQLTVCLEAVASAQGMVCRELDQ